MSKVKFEDYTLEVMEVIDNQINATLEECAGEIESQTKQNSRVDTGQTKNSFQHKVVESEHVAYIGSNHENAIWEEFGTGEFALEGNGHFTMGKKPSRAFWNAYNSLKKAVTDKLQNALKGL